MRATQAWEAHHKAGKTNAITGRFFGTKPMEELYDTSADPDNVNNLIGDPKYAKEIARLSQELDRWQVKHYDSGLLPESEVVKRAEDSGKMIYDFVRDQSLYDVKAYQQASSLALKQDPKNLSQLYANLKNADGGVRYWAMVGCFNLQKKTKLNIDVIRKSLDDDSHHVRVMAAWILYRNGDKQSAQDCWNDLLKNDSYASLKVFNVIDWIGDGTKPYAESMKACKFSHGGYVARMKQYLGAGPPPKKKRNRKKKTQ